MLLYKHTDAQSAYNKGYVCIHKRPEIENPEIKDKGTDKWLFKCTGNV